MAAQRPTWQESHMLQALLVGTRGNCLKRLVGAVLVNQETQRIIASGYNGAPRGDETCLEKDHCHYEMLAHIDASNDVGSFGVLREQYKPKCPVVHAEQNALAQCMLHGVSSRGTTLFVTNFPCETCARLLVQGGIAQVVYRSDYLSNHLLAEDEKRASERIFRHAGVAVKKLTLPISRIKEIQEMMLIVGDRLPYEFSVQGLLTIKKAPGE